MSWRTSIAFRSHTNKVTARRCKRNRMRQTYQRLLPPERFNRPPRLRHYRQHRPSLWVLHPLLAVDLTVKLFHQNILRISPKSWLLRRHRALVPSPPPLVSLLPPHPLSPQLVTIHPLHPLAGVLLPAIASVSRILSVRKKEHVPFLHPRCDPRRVMSALRPLPLFPPLRRPLRHP